jgi:hypothetical protein
MVPIFFYVPDKSHAQLTARLLSSLPNVSTLLQQPNLNWYMNSHFIKNFNTNPPVYLSILFILTLHIINNLILWFRCRFIHDLRTGYTDPVFVVLSTVLKWLTKPRSRHLKSYPWVAEISQSNQGRKISKKSTELSGFRINFLCIIANWTTEILRMLAQIKKQ